MRTSRAFSVLRVLGLAVWLGPFTPAASAGEVSEVKAVSAPDWQLADLDGEPVRLGDYRGRVVLMNFWAGWCTPCLKEMPSLQRLSASMEGKPFALLTINTGESRGAAARSVRQTQVQLPVALDRNGDVFRQWQGRMLPTSFILDREGRVRYRILGDMEWDNDREVGEILEALLHQD